MQITITCIIIEDEPLAMERISTYVDKLSYLRLLGSFDNAIDALVWLKTNKADLIFLDINLPDLTGINLLETKNISSEVIITTAYPDYALKGFDLKVADYLLKPYNLERFIQSVERVAAILNKNHSKQEKKFIFIKTEYRLEKIMLSDILYIEGMRDYRRIVMPGKKIMTLQTFKEFEQDIPSNIICRVHKSYMVAIDKIETIEKDQVKIGNEMIPLSETYKKQFLELIRHSK